MKTGKRHMLSSPSKGKNAPATIQVYVTPILL